MKGLTVSTDSLHHLVERARQGSREAFQEAIAAVEDSLRSTIAARMGPGVRGHLEPEDVFQETLAKAFESLDRFEWRGEDSLLRWLRGIAENVIRSNADRQRRRAVLEVQPRAVASSRVSGGRALRREERFERLRQAVEALRPEYREVILLARIEGLSTAEIAERLGRSVSAVKNLLLRALKELKRSFGDTESLHLPDRRLTRGGSQDVE